MINKEKSMKLYQFTTTEHNGEQEYSNTHLVRAKNIKQANSKAVKFCKKWYEDEDVKIETDNFGYLTFIFIDIQIELELNDIKEITKEQFCKEAYERALIQI